MLRNSSRILNYRFKYEHFYYFENFQSNNIQEMIIEKVCVPNFFQLMGKILQIKNLKKLVIKGCLFEAENNPIEIPIKTKLSLDSLVLRSNKIFTYQLNYLLSSIINLISFDYGYLQLNPVYASKHETEKFIATFLCSPEFSSSIKELNLICGYNGFNSIFNCNHFNLNKFSFYSLRPSVDLNKLECFLNKQTNLIYLGIHFNPNNFSELFFLLKSVCSTLQTIKYISFSFGYQNIENLNDLDFIWKLKGILLRTPLMNYFQSLKTESKLKELHLSNVCLDIYICNSFDFLPNLTCLFLYRTCLKNYVYQAIFKYLLQLRQLYIYDSQKNEVTDFGITGETFGYSITRLTKIETISINDKQNITDVSLKQFSELKSLKNVLLGKTNVSSLSLN